MVHNTNKTDRLIRLIIGLLLMWLTFLTSEDPLLSVGLGLLGICLLITAIVGICPFYLFFGLNSRKRKTGMH